MLIFHVPQGFQEEAERIAGHFGQPITTSQIDTHVKSLFDAMRAGSDGGELSLYGIKFTDQGEVVSEQEVHSEAYVANMLKEGNTAIMVSNDKGATFCVTPIAVNGNLYLQWLNPEAAQSARDMQREMLQKANMEATKSLSIFDWICHAFAKLFLRQPGEAVARRAAYQEFYDNMSKNLDKVATIPEKVKQFQVRQQERQRQTEEDARQQEEEQRLIQEERNRQLEEIYKQQEEMIKNGQRPQPKHNPVLEQHLKSHEREYEEFEQNSKADQIEKERLEKERQEQERIEKERLEQERIEKERIEKERLEKERFEKERLEKERIEEEKRLIKEGEERAMLEEQKRIAAEREQKLVKYMIDTINEKTKELPQKIINKEKLFKHRESVQRDITKADQDLKTVKEAYERNLKQEERLHSSLGSSLAELKQLTKDLEEQDQLKTQNEQKKQVEDRLAKEEALLTQLRQESKSADKDVEDRQAEWYLVANTGHLFEKEPKQYLADRYAEEKLERQRKFDKEKELREQAILQKKQDAEICNDRIKQIKQNTSFWGGRGGKIGENLDNLYTHLKQTEKERSQLEKENKQASKDFEKAEKEFQKAAMNPSAEKLQELTEYLKNGKADHSAKLKAFRDAEERAKEITQKLLNQRQVRDKVKLELENKHGKTGPYDPNQHQSMLDRKERLLESVRIQTDGLKAAKADNAEQAIFINRAEYELQPRKEHLDKLNNECTELEKSINSDQLTIKAYTEQLKSRGISVPKPQPEDNAPAKAPVPGM